MTPESEQLQRRNALRRRLAASLTPEERIERMYTLTQDAWDVLSRNPEALEHYWRRNLKNRAVRRDAAATR